MEDSTYLFRGDDLYTGGSIGFALGKDAEGADIQDLSEHVLRKQKGRTSRYVSFSKELKIARKFTSSQDNRLVIKAPMNRLRELEASGILILWDADQVFDSLRQGAHKLAKKAQ